MTHLGEACCRYAAYVALSENCNIHRSRFYSFSPLLAPCGLRYSSTELGHLSRSRIPKSAAVALTDIIQKRFVVSSWIFPCCCDRVIKAQIVRMNVNQCHPAVLGDPIEFSHPDFRRLLLQQHEEREVLRKSIGKFNVTVGRRVDG